MSRGLALSGGCRLGVVRSWIFLGCIGVLGPLSLGLWLLVPSVQVKGVQVSAYTEDGGNGMEVSSGS